MERFAWKGRIKPGMQAEYKRRHDEIWPEMLALLNGENALENLEKLLATEELAARNFCWLVVASSQ